MAEARAHWTKFGSVWIETQVVAEIELFTLWFKGEISDGKEINLGSYMSAERAAASVADGEHDFQTIYDFEARFALSKLGIPAAVRAWNGFK